MVYDFKHVAGISLLNKQTNNLIYPKHKKSQMYYMNMKKLITVAILTLMTIAVHSQTLKNTSYKNQSGEKVLRLEITLPIGVAEAWQLFTTDEKLKKWIAPLAHIELKSGGYILTNYDKSKSLSDSSSIKLPITSFIENELLVLKVILNDHFANSVRESDVNLQEVIQFIKVDNKHTKIVSSMIGWGTGTDWDKTYDFFVKGNEWTYQEPLTENPPHRQADGNMKVSQHNNSENILFGCYSLSRSIERLLRASNKFDTQIDRYLKFHLCNHFIINKKL
jgi:uncharacterized protein YndB with AHSA1/START domain